MAVEPEWAADDSVVDVGQRVLMATYGRAPLDLVKGEGCRLVDRGGRSYLDFVSGIAVCALGHGHPTVTAALHRAAKGLLHVSNLYWTEPMVRLADRLTAASGMERVFFCNSGTEAVEAGLKAARRARPGRPVLVAFTGSFHGRTMGSLSITAQPAYQQPFAPLVPDVQTLEWGSEAGLNDIDNRVAAVVVEPIQGEGGVRPAPAGFLRAIRARCDDVGALLLLDEVQTGIGRTGSLFAFQQEDIVPDLVATAKGLGGGLPIGALLGCGEAASSLKPGDHGSTFGGGPFVTTVALAVLDAVMAPGFLEAVRLRGAQLEDGLRMIVRRHEAAVSHRGRGLLQGLVVEGTTASAVVEAARNRGLLVVPAGPQVVRLVPPLVVTEAEIQEAIEILRDALG